MYIYVLKLKRNKGKNMSPDPVDYKPLPFSRSIKMIAFVNGKKNTYTLNKYNGHPLPALYLIGMRSVLLLGLIRNTQLTNPEIQGRSKGK